MNRTDSPAKQPKPFGINGPREPILSTTPAGDNTASYESGFPPITMTLKSAGGLPPKGQDMNQILYELSALARWASAGALNAYDSSFATSIGGYPKGSMLISDDSAKIYFSTIDENTNNPNSVSTGWLNLLSFLGGAPIASPTFTGTPAAPTAPAGTNTTQIATTAFATALPGRFLRRIFVTSSGTFTPSTDAKLIKVRVIGGGGGGGAAGATNSGYTAIGGGGGAGGYSEKTISITAGFPTVSITIGSGGIPGGLSGYSGGAGGASSFGSYCSASGGDGGAGTSATNNSSYIMSGGSGGLGSGGDVNAYGQSGSVAIMPPVNGGISGAGGASIMSAGPGGRVGNASGNDGIYGSGASGGISQVSASTQYGGRGGAGIVIVEEYC